MAIKFRTYKQLDLKVISEEVARDWKENNIFKKSIFSRIGKNSYFFYEGPPSANGIPGIHHVMGRTIKDIFCRYHTLKGNQVKRKAGWDTHGLPVELGVEKKLGITKEDIGKKVSVEDYNNACKVAVMRYTTLWNQLTEKIGYWIDTDAPFITYETKYIESIWWALKKLYQKGFLYKGYTIQPYSPPAGTGISSHEMNYPGTYKYITDTSVTAQFKAIKETLPSSIKQHSRRDIFFLAWTTTPWTLPSNTALTIGSNIDYVLLSTYNPYTFLPINVILAKAVIKFFFSGKVFLPLEEENIKHFKRGYRKIPYTILQEFKGSTIVGSRYEQLLPWARPYKNATKAFKVIAGDFVTTMVGTGIVHTSPTFGVDDAAIARLYSIPPMLVLNEKNKPVPIVDMRGIFIDNLPKKFYRRYVRNEYYKDDSIPTYSVDTEIAILLKNKNRAFKVEKYIHSYPHCWRTEKPLLYYPISSWMIKTTAIRNKMIFLNENINWHPIHTGDKRFGYWLSNVTDWNLSRSRFWGIPLPIWSTENGDETIIVGSVEELINEINKSIQKGLMTENPLKNFIVGDMSKTNYENIDLHKHIVDNIILCSPAGSPMYRDPDVIDVWFDSGAMPFAKLHYPFENKNLIDENIAFPADFIAEGVDQTRGWFYTMHAISIMLFDSVAYKNVISNGLVLDQEGKKMSKSKGNMVNPFDVIEYYGPDATRWYMIYNVGYGENLRFKIKGISDIRRKFFGTLYNSYNFFAIYANIDGFCYHEDEISITKRTFLDRWILSKLNSLIKDVDMYYTNYDPTRVTRSLSGFVINDMSNWYVRLCRRRFWQGQYNDDKIAAYQTLYTCLMTIAKIASPIAPFFMDRLYQDLNLVTKKESFESVHITYFPKNEDYLIDKNIEECMILSKNISSMVLALRKKEGIEVRQPLQKLIVVADHVHTYIKKFSSIITQEVNVKEIYFFNSALSESIILHHIRPNYKLLGPKLGKFMKSVAKSINNLTQEDIRRIKKKGIYTLVIKGKKINIFQEYVHISIKNIPHLSMSTNKEITVALDINISEQLEEEGLAREIVNQIQNLRKKQVLKLTDNIILYISTPLPIRRIIQIHKNYICEETIAVELVINRPVDKGVNFLLFKYNIKICIKKIISL